MRKHLHGLFGSAALVAVFLGGPDRAGAQMADSRFSIATWSTGQGLLPDDSVLALTQTHDGYLWLGTLDGMVRFDGVRCTVFDESNTPRLPSSKIVRLFEDSRGNLWVGTHTAGAALISQGHVEPLKIGRGRRTGHLISICEDCTGAVWLLTEDGQLDRYANGQIDVWNMSDSAGQSVIADKAGKVWIGAGRSVDPGTGVFGPAALWDDPASRPVLNELEWQEIEPRDVLASIREIRPTSTFSDTPCSASVPSG